VHGPCQHVLPGAGFTKNEDRSVRFSHDRKHVKESGNLFISSDHVTKRVRFFELLFQGHADGIVQKRSHPSQDTPRFVSQNRSCDGDGNLSVALSQNLVSHLHDVLSRLYGFSEMTAAVTEFRAEDFITPALQGFIGSESGNLLSLPIKECHLPVRVHGEDSHGHASQDSAIVRILSHGHLSWLLPLPYDCHIFHY